LPDPPVVEIPPVVPNVDGKPTEWRHAGPAGRLRFDRYVERRSAGAGAALPSLQDDAKEK